MTPDRIAALEAVAEAARPAHADGYGMAVGTWERLGNAIRALDALPASPGVPVADKRRFPVLGPSPEGCPASVPWAMLEPWEPRAVTNHCQTLEQLARRGGLGACEMVAVLENREWRKMSDGGVARLKELIVQWEAPAEYERGRADERRDVVAWVGAQGHVSSGWVDSRKQFKNAAARIADGAHIPSPPSTTDTTKEGA